MDVLIPVGLVLAIASPILSAVWVVATLGERIAAVRRDVDRHETELRELRRVGAL